MEKKFKIGQTAYSAQEYKLGRWILDSYTTTEDANGIHFEYIFSDPTGRKMGFSEEEVESFFFLTLDAAKELALQNWEAEKNRMENALKNLTDSAFDELTEKYRKKAEASK